MDTEYCRLYPMLRRNYGFHVGLLLSSSALAWLPLSEPTLLSLLQDLCHLEILFGNSPAMLL